MGIGFFQKMLLEQGPKVGEGVSPADLEGARITSAKTLSQDQAWCAENRWRGRKEREGAEGCLDMRSER